MLISENCFSTSLAILVISALALGGCGGGAMMGAKDATIEKQYDGFVKVHTNDYDPSTNETGSDVALRAFVPKKNGVTVDTSEVAMSTENLDDIVYQVHFDLKREGEFGRWGAVQAMVDGEEKEYRLHQSEKEKDCSSDPCTYTESVYARIPISDFDGMGQQSVTQFSVQGPDNLEQSFEVTKQEFLTLFATARTR